MHSLNGLISARWSWLGRAHHYINLLFIQKMNLDKPFKPWLFQVAHNFCIDEIRSKRRRMTQSFSTLIIMDEETNTECLLDIEDPCSSIEEICEQHDIQSAVRRALKALSLKARNVVILRCTSNTEDVIQACQSRVYKSMARCFMRLQQ